MKIGVLGLCVVLLVGVCVMLWRNAGNPHEANTPTATAIKSQPNAMEIDPSDAAMSIGPVQVPAPIAMIPRTVHGRLLPSNSPPTFITVPSIVLGGMEHEPTVANHGGIVAGLSKPYRPDAIAEQPVRLSAAGAVSALNLLGRVRSATAPPLELRREKQEAAAGHKGATADIKIHSGFSCSAPVSVTHLSPTHLAVRFKGTRGSLDNYFLFRIDGCAGKTVRIDFDNAPLGKWWSLNPLYSYVTDLSDPANFQSVAVAHPKPPARAWNGALLPDTSDQRWHFIPDVWTEVGIGAGVRASSGRLCMVQTFEKNSAYVALKVPYTPALNENILTSMAGRGGLNVLTIGRSPDGNPLRIIKIGTAFDGGRRSPCILIYAREHATEQDASWAALGAARFLASSDKRAADIRKRFTVFVIPLLDPEGASRSFYNYMTDGFQAFEENPMSVAYANFFRSWIADGNRLDLVINLHNVGSAESPQLSCSVAEPEAARGHYADVLNDFIYERVQAAGFSVNERPPMRTFFSYRLGGWLRGYFGSMHMLYEVNSQDKVRHLLPKDLQTIGREILIASARFLKSQDGTSLMKAIDVDRVRQAKRRSIVLPPDVKDDAIRAEYERLIESGDAVDDPYLKQ